MTRVAVFEVRVSQYKIKFTLQCTRRNTGAVNYVKRGDAEGEPINPLGEGETVPCV